MTDFADMPTGTRRRWLDWANSHDWGAGRARWNDDGTMRVQVAVAFADDSEGVETYDAKDPADLRGWAGY